MTYDNTTFGTSQAPDVPQRHISVSCCISLTKGKQFSSNYFQVHYDTSFKISPYKFMTDIWGKIYYAVHLHKGVFSGFYFDDKMPYIDIVVQFHLATLMVGCTRSVWFMSSILSAQLSLLHRVTSSIKPHQK